MRTPAATRIRAFVERHGRCWGPGMEAAEHGPRYTAECVYCGRTIFREARRIGDLQRRVIENHMLICRPLVQLTGTSTLLRHCHIRESA